MFDMFSPKSAMITTSVSAEGLNPLSFCPTTGSKGCFIFLTQYLKCIYFVCHSGSKEQITFILSCDSALNLKPQYLKMTKDVIRR